MRAVVCLLALWMSKAGQVPTPAPKRRLLEKQTVAGSRFLQAAPKSGGRSASFAEVAISVAKHCSTPEEKASLLCKHLNLQYRMLHCYASMHFFEGQYLSVGAETVQPLVFDIVNYTANTSTPIVQSELQSPIVLPALDMDSPVVYDPAFTVQSETVQPPVVIVQEKSRDCLRNLVDDLYEDINVTVPSEILPSPPSFVCVNDQTYNPEAVSFAGMNCNEAIATLLGDMYWTINSTNLNQRMCNNILPFPGGRPGYRLGSVIIEAGKTCCGPPYNGNPVCDEWAQFTDYR